MIRALAIFALLCGVLFIYGFLMADRIRITTRTAKPRPDFYVMITLPSVTPDYRWLKVFGCSAEMLEDAGVRCIPEGWDTSSMKETRIDQRQYEVPWGSRVPKGMLQVSAVVFDQEWKVLAQGQTVVFR